MTTKNYENIIYEKKPPVAYVTLNRPEKLNALSLDLQAEVKDALEDAGWKDDAIRVIVLKGAGRGFSAGFDISGELGGDMVEIRSHYFKDKSFGASIWWDVFWNNPKPLIAQVNGYCIAGGCATAMFCDLRVCSEDALFGVPEIRIIGPYIQGMWPWMIGMTKAREMLYTGNLMDAREAYRVGVVNEVAPLEKLDEAVDKLAQSIAKVPAAVVEYNKKLVNMAYEMMNIRPVIERSSELEAACLSSPDSVPEIGEFQRLQKEQGLNAALKWNSDRFAEEDAWWKTAKK